MSLTPKRRTTEKKLAANRSNGRKSRGAVTPRRQGARCPGQFASRILCAGAEGALAALGEDPEEYARAHEIPANQSGRGSGRASWCGCIGDTLWRMKRAVRMQNGLAAKRVQSGLEMDELVTAPRMLGIHGIYEPLCVIGRMLNRPDSTPSPGEIAAMVKAFGATPPDDVRRLFPLLRAYGEAAAEAPGPAKKTAIRVHPFGRRGAGKGSGAPEA